MWCSLHTRRIAATSLAVSRQEDSNRDDRRRAERLVVRVLVVRIAGEDAIGGQDTVELCRHDVVRCSLLPWICLARLTSRWGTDIPGR